MLEHAFGKLECLCKSQFPSWFLFPRSTHSGRQQNMALILGFPSLLWKPEPRLQSLCLLPSLLPSLSTILGKTDGVQILGKWRKENKLGSCWSQDDGSMCYWNNQKKWTNTLIFSCVLSMSQYWYMSSQCLRNGSINKWCILNSP